MPLWKLFNIGLGHCHGYLVLFSFAPPNVVWFYDFGGKCQFLNKRLRFKEWAADACVFAVSPYTEGVTAFTTEHVFWLKVKVNRLPAFPDHGLCPAWTQKPGRGGGQLCAGPRLPGPSTQDLVAAATGDSTLYAVRDTATLHLRLQLGNSAATSS